MSISVWNVHTTLYWWLSDDWSLMKCNSTRVRWWAIVINAYRMHLQTNHTHRGCWCTVSQLITYQRSESIIAQYIHLLIETLQIILCTHTLVLHLPLPAHSRMTGACLTKVSTQPLPLRCTCTLWPQRRQTSKHAQSNRKTFLNREGT